MKRDKEKNKTRRGSESVCVRACVYMHVCSCMCVGMHARMRTCVLVCMHMCARVLICVRMSVCACMSVYACKRVCVCACMCMWLLLKCRVMILQKHRGAGSQRAFRTLSKSRLTGATNL